MAKSMSLEESLKSLMMTTMEWVMSDKL